MSHMVSVTLTSANQTPHSQSYAVPVTPVEFRSGMGPRASRRCFRIEIVLSGAGGRTRLLKGADPIAQSRGPDRSCSSYHPRIRRLRVCILLAVDPIGPVRGPDNIVTFGTLKQTFWTPRRVPLARRMRGRILGAPALWW